MKEFARGFYFSPEWRRCRAAYISSKRGLCETCLEKGIITPGKIVHHIIELTPNNINDPSITLNYENLRCVCDRCHAEAHKRQRKRWTIDDYGRVCAIREEADGRTSENMVSI